MRRRKENASAAKVAEMSRLIIDKVVRVNIASTSRISFSFVSFIQSTHPAQLETMSAALLMSDSPVTVGKHPVFP